MNAECSVLLIKPCHKRVNSTTEQAFFIFFSQFSHWISSEAGIEKVPLTVTFFAGPVTDILFQLTCHTHANLNFVEMAAL